MTYLNNALVGVTVIIATQMAVQLLRRVIEPLLADSIEGLTEADLDQKSGRLGSKAEVTAEQAPVIVPLLELDFPV